MPDDYQEFLHARRNRIIWHYIEEARKPPPPPPPGLITISGVSAATNGVFVIDSIATNTSWASNTIPYSVYDVERPSRERAILPEALRKRREKAKAARKARKKGRR